jgi:protein-L-isoaspartate(D-aspartate) O-methyltransferase
MNMAYMDFEQARFNMIEQQIRPWDVLDQRVLDLVSMIPREKFVPFAYHNLAFADIQIPLGHDQVMMEPKLEARLLQSLQLKPNNSVLEIGTGSGYLTALLAESTQHVDSVDIFSDFIAEAGIKLKNLNIQNVSLNVGDAIQGWNQDKRYDVIVLTGSLPVLPAHFQEQLKLGGRLFAIVGEEPIMEAQLITRFTEQQWDLEILFETAFPPLIGAPQSEILWL